MGLNARYRDLTDWFVLRCPWLPRAAHLRSALLRWRGAKVGVGLRLGAGARIYGYEHLEIGDHSGIAERNVIALGPKGRMVIGSDTFIGPECYFRNAHHQYDQLDVSIMLQGHISKDIIIGNHVWIGARCILLGGATIGDFAILAAGSVVSFEIPAYSIAVGNPARVVKRRNGAPLRTEGSRDSAELLTKVRSDKT